MPIAFLVIIRTPYCTVHCIVQSMGLRNSRIFGFSNAKNSLSATPSTPSHHRSRQRRYIYIIYRHWFVRIHICIDVNLQIVLVPVIK
jgi:hypothetical protein